MKNFFTSVIALLLTSLPSFARAGASSLLVEMQEERGTWASLLDSG
jgi:hypothetical protein